MHDQTAADRREYVDCIESMRRDGTIRLGEEAALIRLYNDRADRLEQAMAKMTPEYERRLQADGEESALKWLREQAEALGRADGAETVYAFSRAVST